MVRLKLEIFVDDQSYGYVIDYPKTEKGLSEVLKELETHIKTSVKKENSVPEKVSVFINRQ